jgi:molybdenum cofactor cytidylyltransferase
VPDLSIILLAAGKSERMGTHDKLLLTANNQPLIQLVLNQLMLLETVEIIVVANSTNAEKINRRIPPRVKLVVNLDYQTGMTSSIRAGIKATDASSTGYMICLSDQPDIKASTYDLIKKAFIKAEDESLITVPYYHGQKGNPIIFGRKYRDELLNHMEPDGCKQIIEDHKAKILRVDLQNAQITLDIDTHADYLQFKKRVGEKE